MPFYITYGVIDEDVVVFGHSEDERGGRMDLVFQKLVYGMQEG
jgi:hypothetical protein